MEYSQTISQSGKVGISGITLLWLIAQQNSKENKNVYKYNPLKIFLCNNFIHNLDTFFKNSESFEVLHKNTNRDIFGK